MKNKKIIIPEIEKKQLVLVSLSYNQRATDNVDGLNADDDSDDIDIVVASNSDEKTPEEQNSANEQSAKKTFSINNTTNGNISQSIIDGLEQIGLTGCWDITSISRVCDMLSVKAIVEKIPQENTIKEVELKRESKNDFEFFRMAITDVADVRKLSETLAKHNIILKQSNQYALADYLRADIDYAISNKKFIYEHTPLGFYEYKDKNYFFGEQTRLDETNTSTCIRNFGKFTKGSEEIYDKMLKEFVFPDKHLTLAYILGFSGVIASRLFDDTDVNVPIFGFNGRSSTGKSISCMLAVSTFANPNLQTGALMIKTDSSQNGQYAQLSNLNGLPFVFDDIDVDSTRNISDTLYRLANGTPRTVSDVNGNARKRGSWRGVILLNSETSLAENIHKNGIDARYCEFNDIVWTKSAEIAEKIRETISENFGFKGWRFGNYVTNQPRTKILNDFKECKEKIKNSLKNKDSLSSRIASKYAVILQTTNYLNEFFSININAQEIIDFLVENEENNLNNRDKIFSSYSYIFDFFNTHRQYFNVFKSDKTETSAKGICWGDAKYVEGQMLYICIRTNMLKKIMLEGGFNQFKSYREGWKKRGYIEYDDNRFNTSNKKLGRHYKFVFDINDVQIDGENDENI